MSKIAIINLLKAVKCGTFEENFLPARKLIHNNQRNIARARNLIHAKYIFRCARKLIRTKISTSKVSKRDTHQNDLTLIGI